MSLRFLICFLIALLAGPTALAQQDDKPQKLGLRVSSSAGPKVVVDRGESDKIAVGDAVSFSPRRGGTFTGKVIELRERESVVAMDDPNVNLEPGTRGEISIPSSRFAVAEEPPAKTDEKTPSEHPPWKNKDDEYKKGAPLLTEVPPVRPQDRARSVTGRYYLLADITKYLADDFTNSFLRTGTDLTVENVFKRGGNLRVNLEAAYLTNFKQEEGWDFLVRRLSYYTGGTRFEANRWEFGRFLQYGVPEFGILDGFEFNRRVNESHSFGLSGGFMPEPLDDYFTFNADDVGFAGFYRFVSDSRETFAFSLGYQKTWHNTNADRDLFVLKSRWLPESGWFLDLVMFLDYYTGNDDLKGGGLDFTYILLTASRTWKSGNGMEFTYKHQEFPEIDRLEFLPVEDNQTTSDYMDRLTFEGWRWIANKTRLRGNLVGWLDQDDTGGAADGSIEWRDLWAEGTRFDLTGLFSVAKFEDIYGGRVTVGWSNDRYSWDFLYEVTWRHLEGFPDDRDDLIQHWIRVSGGVHVWKTWDLNWYAQLILYDEENSWSVGVNLQKRF